MPEGERMPRDGYLGVGDAAKLLGVSRQTVHNRIQAGRYRGDKVLDGKQERFEIPVEDVRQDLTTGSPGTEEIRQFRQYIDESASGIGELPFGERREDKQAVLELMVARRDALEQVADHLEGVWKINGDVVRLLERQLEKKDQMIESMAGLIYKLEAEIERNTERILSLRQESESAGERLSQELEFNSAKDMALRERVAELERRLEEYDRSFWRRLFG